MLFGSFLGVTDAQVVTLLVVAVVVLLAVAVVARPLLFASVDPDVADARGVPVRFLSIVFLVCSAVAVAAASQITGSLLVFALLVVPAATAQTITARPVAPDSSSRSRSRSRSPGSDSASAYYSPYPVGFWITTDRLRRVRARARAARRSAQVFR